MTPSIPGPAYRIQTPRLVIRCWNPSDAEAMQEAILSSLEHLRPWMPWAEKEDKETLEDKIARLRLFRGKFDLGEDFIYGIFDRGETRVLGGTGLHTRLGSRVREIGYWIRQDAVGQGLASETAAALTRVGFEIETIDRIEIHCDPENVRSAAVPRKLGYTLDAVLRQRFYRSPGVYTDSMIWSLLAADYPATPCAQQPIEAFDAAGRRIL